MNPVDNLPNFFKKLWLYGQEYGQICLQWQLKTLKVQNCKFQKIFSRKRLDKISCALGKEFYNQVVKSGRTDWTEISSIKELVEHLKLSEANLNSIDRKIEELNGHFQEKKREIKEKFKALRSQVEQQPKSSGE